MRITSAALRPQLSVLRAPEPSRARAVSAPLDVFESAAVGGTSALAATAAPTMATQSASSAAAPASASPMQQLLEQLVDRVKGLLEGLLAKLLGKAPQAPATPGTSPVGGTAPVGGTSPASGALAPTPFAPENPNAKCLVNTIQEPHIAPRSQFRDAVNQAIDAVRAKGIGIDPNDPDAITDFNAYHQGVVAELRARGYSAAHDGEELSVSRNGDSSMSESFDISTWQGRVRRFYASWTSPSVFG